MHRGFVKIYRKIEDSGLLQKGDVLALFVHILIRANYKHGRVLFGMQYEDLEPGQVVVGRKVLSATLRQSEDKIRRGLKILKNMNIITIVSTNRYSVITIENWDTYQGYEPANDQQTPIKPPTDRQQSPNGPPHLKKDKHSNIKERERESAISDDAIRIAGMLRDLMLKDDPGAKIPVSLSKWEDAIDMLNRID